MTQRVFVTGATGFVGRAIVAELIARGYEVNALVRNANRASDLPGNVNRVAGDISNPASLQAGMAGCSAVIHLVGIIMPKPRQGITFETVHVEGTRSVVTAAKAAGIRRYVQMSALGTGPDAKSDYHRTKFQAEQIVQSSGLDWTILRPSLIHGLHGDFMKQEAQWARKSAPAPIFFMPFMPYFGAGLFGNRGAGLLQPVYIDDVAKAFVDCLEKSNSIGQIYPLAGSERVDWPTLHHAVSNEVVGKSRWVFPIPAWLGKYYAAIGIAPLLGFNRDQVIMSQEDNTADMTSFTRDFGWTPAGISQTLPLYARQL